MEILTQQMIFEYNNNSFTVLFNKYKQKNLRLSLFSILGLRFWDIQEFDRRLFQISKNKNKKKLVKD